jgi:ribonuclease Z
VLFELKILGANSASPVYNRHHTSQLLTIEDTKFLIDCGEATQHQLIKYHCKPNKIDYIFISHLHGDHYLGLVGLLSTMHLQGRSKPLTLFAPQPLSEIITIQLKYSETVLNYPLKFVATNTNSPELILELEKVKVHSFPLNHRIPCCGFLFEEKPRKRRINKEKFPPNGSLAHMAMLKLGNDVLDDDGKILYDVANYTLPPYRSRSYAFCSDTIYMPQNADFLNGVDMLYHEATFLHEMLQRATDTFHTTAKQAAEFANLCKAKQLIIGHYSSRYKDTQPLLDEACLYFPNTLPAIEGNDYGIPITEV